MVHFQYKGISKKCYVHFKYEGTSQKCYDLKAHMESKAFIKLKIIGGPVLQKTPKEDAQKLTLKNTLN